MNAGVAGVGASRTVGIVLVAAGALALAYGGFTYTRDTQQAKIGPLELSVKDTRKVDIPLWVGVGAIAAGGWSLIARR